MSVINNPLFDPGPAQRMTVTPGPAQPQPPQQQPQSTNTVVAQSYQGLLSVRDAQRQHIAEVASRDWPQDMKDKAMREFATAPRPRS